MIHFAKMRATLCVLVGFVTWAAGATWAVGAARAAGAAPPTAVAVYWQPSGHPALGVEAGAAFARAVAGQGARLVDATAPEGAAPALAPRLAAGKAAYARFAFADAIAALDDLQRLVDALGGGELDARQLSELFLYRGLARLETAGAEAAWDDLVRAARLDPGRVVDPAQFPPRAVTAFKRAVEEATAVPRAALTVDVPEGATVRVDGQAAPAGVAVALGPHLVSVAAPGYERWAGVVSVASARERFTPPLRAQRPPDGDRLLALAGEPAPRRLILGALVIAPAGWRFDVSEVALPEGQAVADSVALGDVPTRYAVAALVDKVAPGPRAPTPLHRRWSTWIITGGAVVLLGLATTLFLTRDTTSPNVTGSVGSLK
jgi:PEGA domain